MKGRPFWTSVGRFSLISASKQNWLIKEDRASHSYLTVLHTLLTQGKAVLSPKDATYIPSPKPGLSLIGWFDSEIMYLDPNEPYRLVQQYFRESGQVLTVSDDDLKYEFKEACLSICDADRPNRTTKTITIQGKKRRLLQLKIAEVEKLIEADGLVTTLEEGWKRYQGIIVNGEPTEMGV